MEQNTTSKQLTGILDGIHNVRAGLGELSMLLEGRDEYGLASILRSLRDTLENHLGDLENVELRSREAQP